MNTQDIKIAVDLDVYCTKRSPTDFHRVKSVKLNGFEIFSELCDGDLLYHGDVSEILNKWCMTDKETVKTIEHDIEFECRFDDDGMLDDVELGYESIMDILSDEILDDLKTMAKEDLIADCKDRGLVANRLDLKNKSTDCLIR